MGAIKKDYRLIDGKKFYITTTSGTRTKSSALKEAKWIRSKGFGSRVIACKGGYRVFSSRQFKKPREGKTRKEKKR